MVFSSFQDRHQGLYFSKLVQLAEAPFGVAQGTIHPAQRHRSVLTSFDVAREVRSSH